MGRNGKRLIWVALGLLGFGEWSIMADAAWSGPQDETTAIQLLTANPGANNRRAVKLQGHARGVSEYRGEDSFGRTLCGQGFTLEDDTGAIDVLNIVRCHSTEVPVLIGEGDQVVVYATIDGTPTNIKNAQGKELTLKAMATKIIRVK